MEKMFPQFAKSSLFECEKPKTRNASFPSERFINRTEFTKSIVDLEKKKHKISNTKLLHV